MALPESKFRYSGIANPDLTAGAKLIMAGLQTPGNLANQMQEQDRANVLLKLKQQEAQQGQQLFDLKMQEQDRLNKDRAGKELLASELMKLPTQKSSTSVVTPAVTQADVNSVRDGLLNKQYDVGTKYSEVFDKLSGETISKPVPGQFKESSNYTSVNVPGTQNQKYTDSATGESLMFDPNSVVGKLVYGDKYFKKDVPIDNISEVQKYTPEQMHEIALKESGYSSDIGVYEDKLPKLSKEVTKTTMKNLSETDLKQGKLDLIKRLTNEGSIPATMALEVANKINAPKTKKEQLDELKYLLDVKEAARKDKELEAKIKSGYFGKSSSGKGFSFGEKLYTAAGPDGLDAAREYLKNNKNDLSNMSTGDKKELLAYLTAKYGHEDDWFNWTGWDDLK